jgi:hypothetical protein
MEESARVDIILGDDYDLSNKEINKLAGDLDNLSSNLDNRIDAMTVKCAESTARVQEAKALTEIIRTGKTQEERNEKSS